MKRLSKNAQIRRLRKAIEECLVEDQRHFGQERWDAPCNEYCTHPPQSTGNRGHRPDIPRGRCDAHPDIATGDGCLLCSGLDALRRTP